MGPGELTAGMALLECAWGVPTLLPIRRWCYGCLFRSTKKLAVTDDILSSMVPSKLVSLLVRLAKGIFPWNVWPVFAAGGFVLFNTIVASSRSWDWPMSHWHLTSHSTSLLRCCINWWVSLAWCTSGGAVRWCWWLRLQRLCCGILWIIRRSWWYASCDCSLWQGMLYCEWWGRCLGGNRDPMNGIACVTSY